MIPVAKTIGRLGCGLPVNGASSQAAHHIAAAFSIGIQILCLGKHHASHSPGAFAQPFETLVARRRGHASQNAIGRITLDR
jgi:hypothetical protein